MNPICSTLPPEPRYSVGVDGGGTGTRARLQDATGSTLGLGHGGPSGLGQGIEQAWRHVQQAVADAFAQSQLSMPAPSSIELGLGLAGAGVTHLRTAFLAADPGYARCVLNTDSMTQLLGAHDGRPGLVVAAGTGSVAAARDRKGRFHQCGGWGFASGDEGSGAWLGVRAMGHAQHVLDGRAALSTLAEAVLRLAGPGVSAVQSWCVRAGPSEWASLAPLVFDAAEAGDAVAIGLLDRAAHELGRLVAALDTRAEEPLPIVMRGSVGERLVQRWPVALSARLVQPQGDSCDGALRLLQSHDLIKSNA